jgi:predicted nucleic acid binding AN1-type Zn finger protein
MDQPTSEGLPVTLESLQLRVRQLEAENAAMRPIVQRMAEGRICRDAVTMIEACPHCSVKRGGEFGYSGKHDANCVVTLARALGY